MLYLIGTPIGNLEDISLRALRTLKECDYVLAEDTRISRRLFDKYEITTRLISFHQFSEHEREAGVIRDLLSGKNIGLISDAGMPAISDPGEKLVERCREEGIPTTVIPGPSAVTSAMSLYGDTEGKPFQFVGFLPKKGQRPLVAQIAFYDGISILFESPHRVGKTLSLFPDDLKVVVIREITKIYEEVITGTPLSLKDREYRGECVILIRGEPKQELSEKHIHFLQEKLSLSDKDTFKILAKLFAE
ncbi:MAG: 16S rRNA (cytidine(1402)-2'-O)-methyltransferase [Simkaniaceae bacterium]|nr:16S rRNA (cytidine(1402)-2'-O)-methyltransferase [Simkaniaceae bacterium]